MIIYTGKTTSRRWNPEELTWFEFCSRLRETHRTEETMAEYQRMSASAKGEVKGRLGGFVGGELFGINTRRKAENVKNRCMVCLDADNAWPGMEEDVVLDIDWTMCVYSTHSHTPEQPRLRFIFPLSRPIDPEMYECVARVVAQHIGIDAMDKSTYEPSRLMYWPTTSSDGEYICKVMDAQVVNPDKLLRETFGPGDAWKDRSRWPVGSDEVELVARECKHAGEPTEKVGIVGAFCRAFDVPAVIDTFLSDVYEECYCGSGEPRYTYLAGSTAGGAIVYNDGAFLYSNHATDPAHGHSVNAFDLVRLHKFGELDTNKNGSTPPPDTPVTKLRSYAAMCEFAAGLDEVKRMVGQEEFGDLVGQRIGDADEDETDEDEADEADEAEVDPDAWKADLELNNKTGQVEPTVSNILLILQNDRELKGIIAYNEFSSRVVLRRSSPWGHVVIKTLDGEQWTDLDRAELMRFLERKWKIVGNEKRIDTAFSCAQNANRYHPVREYLDRLTWDGVERLDTMLVRWMGADDSAYTRAVTRKWLTAGVARIYEPGRKFDQMLVLSGPQGIGKSKLGMSLAKGWHTDSIRNLESKEAYEQLQGKWIVELGELAATRKSEVECVKNFITKQEDSYRPAYGHYSQTFPRQGIFYGSTNSDAFLRDYTGNRRFWPVAVTGFERGRLSGFEEEVDQLWAEAKHRYRAGESLWLDDEVLWKEAEEQQVRFTEEDDTHETARLIEEYLSRPVPEDWYDREVDWRSDYVQGGTASLVEGTMLRNRISISEIRRELLGESPKDITRGNSYVAQRVTRALALLPEWKKNEGRRRVPGYGACVCWERLEQTDQN